VEQKNWTHVRQLLGYGRLEDPDLIPRINDLYQTCWEPLHNYFLPSAKLIGKTRDGAKVSRKHDAPATPCDRILADASVPEETKKALRKARKQLNPFHLKDALEKALKPILAHALPARRPPGSLPAGPPHATTPKQPTTVS